MTEIPFTSVRKMFEKSFREHWEVPALSNYQGITLTYGEVAMKIAKIHIGFGKCGLEAGDKVAICSRNQANWGVCFLAALTYGAVPVPILHEFKAENIHYLVNHSDARVFFVDEVIWEGLSESEMPALQVIVRMNDLKYIYAKDKAMRDVRYKLVQDFGTIYTNGFHPDDLDYYRDSPDELALINYTSGTSGFSKGVMLPYRALYANVLFAREEAEPQMNCESEVVAMLPSAHMYGMLFEFLFEMTIGAHVHFLTRVPSPKIIMSAFQEIKPDIIIAVPLIIEKVYKSQIKPVVDRNKLYMLLPILDQYILKKIRNGMIDAFGGRFEEIIIGGAAFNPEVEAFLRKIHFPFTVCYGMTECGPIVTYAKWYRTKKGSCGKPVAGCQIRIDSRNPYKEPGEIQVKGDNVFLGYYKNKEATRQSFTNDGWYKTGDMGVIDNDGYLYLRGRSKCMILGPSGQNIYPEELEDKLNALPLVSESLVVSRSKNIIALVVPDWENFKPLSDAGHKIEDVMADYLQQVNASLPSYCKINKIEVRTEPFEKTPKKSIKRFLYK